MKESKLKAKLIRIILILGIIISLVSFLENQWPPLEALCGIFSSGCKQAAEFTLFQIPIPIWGIAFYLFLLIIQRVARTWTFRFVMAGVGVEATLVWLMLTRDIVCFFCLLNAFVMVLLLLLYLQRSQIWQSVALCLIGYLIAGFLLVKENPASTVSQTHITGNSVVARVNEDTITLADLESGIATKLYKMRQDIYKFKRDQLLGLIEETLTRQQQNQATSDSDDAAAGRHENSVTATTRRLFDETLSRQPNIDRYLEKPPLPYTSIPIGNSPSMGPEDVAVTIIEFSDYLCPACKWAHPITKEIKKRYQGKIRWVFKDFPLRRHPGADKLAEAARCAGEQDRFWEFQDLLFDAEEHPDPMALSQFARSLNLDARQFDQCMESEKYATDVINDKRDAGRAGVSSTPSFMINGRLNPGSLRLESFAELIDEAFQQSKP